MDQELERLKARNVELESNQIILVNKAKQQRKDYEKKLKKKDEIIKEKERIIAELSYKQQKLF